MHPCIRASKSSIVDNYWRQHMAQWGDFARYVHTCIRAYVLTCIRACVHPNQSVWRTLATIICSARRGKGSHICTYVLSFYVHTCISASVHPCIQLNEYATLLAPLNKRGCGQGADGCMRAYVHTCILACAHTCVCAYMHGHMRAYVHNTRAYKSINMGGDELQHTVQAEEEGANTCTRAYVR